MQHGTKGSSEWVRYNMGRHRRRITISEAHIQQIQTTVCSHPTVRMKLTPSNGDHAVAIQCDDCEVYFRAYWPKMRGDNNHILTPPEREEHMRHGPLIYELLEDEGEEH